MGGEKQMEQGAGRLWVGSPPRGRGKGQLSVGHQIRERITSAWAGKSSWTKAISTRTLDHPRMGGEKMNKRYEEGRKPGSPPRGRGKVIAQRHALFGVGITPAWAGKSQSSFRAVLLHGDHPRVGGEKGSYRWVIKSVKGSPPHGRGKVRGRKPFLQEPWITPAWAGKRGRFAERKAPSWDHPRMGGEKKKSRRCCTSIGGSPPHGRGKARHLSHGLLPCG